MLEQQKTMIKRHLYRMDLRNEKGCFSIRFEDSISHPLTAEQREWVDSATDACMSGGSVTSGPYTGCFVDQVKLDTE